MPQLDLHDNLCDTPDLVFQKFENTFFSTKLIKNSYYSLSKKDLRKNIIKILELRNLQINGFQHVKDLKHISSNDLKTFRTSSDSCSDYFDTSRSSTFSSCNERNESNTYLSRKKIRERPNIPRLDFSKLTVSPHEYTIVEKRQKAKSKLGKNLQFVMTKSGKLEPKFPTRVVEKHLFYSARTESNLKILINEALVNNKANAGCVDNNFIETAIENESGTRIPPHLVRNRTI